MAVFLARAEDLERRSSGTGGCDIEGHLYEGQIRAVLAAGIATGDADGCFHPDDPVTRGQMATFLVTRVGPLARRCHPRPVGRGQTGGARGGHGGRRCAACRARRRRPTAADAAPTVDVGRHDARPAPTSRSTARPSARATSPSRPRDADAPRAGADARRRRRRARRAGRRPPPSRSTPACSARAARSPADQRALRRIGAETAWASSAPRPASWSPSSTPASTSPTPTSPAASPPSRRAARRVRRRSTRRPRAPPTARQRATARASPGSSPPPATSRGIAGVAFGGVAVRSYTALGPDLRGTTADVAAAVHCAIDDGVDVINLSLTAGDTTAMRNALDRAEAAGVVVVAAAGNGGNGAHPGAVPRRPPVGARRHRRDRGLGRRAPGAVRQRRRAGSTSPPPAPASCRPPPAAGGRSPTARPTRCRSCRAPPPSCSAALAGPRRRRSCGPASSGTAEPLADATVGRGPRRPVRRRPLRRAGAAGVRVAGAGVGARRVRRPPPLRRRARRRRPARTGRAGTSPATSPPSPDGPAATCSTASAPCTPSAARRASCRPPTAPGWDIARGADRRADGSVVVLDGQGGLHVAGGGPAIGPGGPWWPGHDIARDVAVDPATRPGPTCSTPGAACTSPVPARRRRGSSSPATRPGATSPAGSSCCPRAARGYVLDAARPPAPVGGRRASPLPPPVAAATASVGDAGRGVARRRRRAPHRRSPAAAPWSRPSDDPCRPAPRWPGRDLARAVVVAP